MTKPSSEIHPIIIKEALYRFTSYVLCLQFWDAFATHFSPHQFIITTKGGCEVVIHGIWCTLDLHPNWVVFQLNVANAFNLMLKGSYFKNFVQQVGTSYNLSLLFVHSIHFNLLYFLIIITMMVMSWSSLLPWEFVKVILWERHYLP